MLTTIQLSPYIFVQGPIIATHPGGRVSISVDGTEYVGEPVKRTAPRPQRRELALVAEQG